jgi:hypothetical protein
MSQSNSAAIFALLLTCNRVHNQSEYFRNDEAEAYISGAQKHTWEEGIMSNRRYTSKWALLWRSIIRSSLGNTAYPYSLYIRSLDLRNLATLLEDPQFRDVASETFFADDMAAFLKAQETPIKKKARKTKASQLRLNVAPILELVGESITRHVSEAAHRNQATVALEDLAGKFVNPPYPTFCPQKDRRRARAMV